MAKDYAKFVPSKPRASRRKTWHVDVLLIIFFLIVVLIGGLYIFQKQLPAAPNGEQGIKGLMVRVSLLFHHHPKAPVAVKKSTADTASDQPEPVHFDFYSQLPNMQVTLPESEQATLPPNAKPLRPPVMAKTNPVELSHQAISPPAVSPAVVKKPSANQSAATPVNPEELSTMIEAEMKPQAPTKAKTSGQSFYIEMGSYDSREAANLFADAITSAGFQTAVVKVYRNGRPSFVVRHGQFTSQELAKSTQLRMQKRGIIGEIHKAT